MNVDGFPSLSVFFPAYTMLPNLIHKTFAVLDEHVADYEVVVVNEGSCDKTAEVPEGLHPQYGPALRVITHLENRGYGGTLRGGFAAAKKEFVLH